LDLIPPTLAIGNFHKLSAHHVRTGVKKAITYTKYSGLPANSINKVFMESAEAVMNILHV
jgi:hypothetical protein